MSKPYFTKYLPVEGEIKEGDKIQYESRRGLNQETATKDNIGAIRLVGNNIKKEKLFLCSKDLTVGVSTKFVSDTGIIYDGIMSAPDGTTFLDRFQVIGEISPNAIWVKEGDEFDDTQVRRAIRISMVGDCYRKSCKIGEEPDFDIPDGRIFQYGRFDKGIEVLCPTCKTFH